MKTLFSRFAMVLTLVAVVFGGLALDTRPVKAAGHETFNVSVYHGINGRNLGLSKELPVIAEVYLNGDLAAEIPLEFQDRFTADLPAGNYLIKVWSVELGAYVNSMTVGPVALPADINVRLQAQLGPGGTPIISVRAFAAEVYEAPETFNVSVYHGINGRSLGLSMELPVIAEVYKDGALLAQVPLEFKERFSADLPAGNYLIKVKSVELGAYVDSMTVGPVDLPGGIDLRLQAQLGPGNTPILSTNVR